MLNHYQNRSKILAYNDYVLLSCYCVLRELFSQGHRHSHINRFDRGVKSCQILQKLVPTIINLCCYGLVLQNHFLMLVRLDEDRQ